MPLWHPWAEFFKGKNKMAAKYFKVKYDFLTNEARNKCNTSFSGQSISCIILMTQGHLQGQKDNFKVKEPKIPFLTNKDRNMCNTSFTWDFI